MEIKPPYLRIYQQILKDLENALPFLNVPKAKAGSKPKLTDIHIAAILILSYITNTKVLTLAQLLIDHPYNHGISSEDTDSREYKDGCYMDVCEFRFSARFSFWHIKEWQGIFKVF